MQERVLGAIIIGGIALVGVVWALIDGVPTLVEAKSLEKELENTLVTIVNEKYDAGVTSLDIKRASYQTEIVIETNKFGKETKKYMPVVYLEGYNNEGQQFECSFVSSTNYIQDLQNKIGSSSATANEALQYDLYQNYTLTTASTINTIINDTSATTFRGYYIDNGLYGAITGDSGSKIVNVGDPTKANGKENNPYSADEIVTMEEAPSKTVYFYGEVTELTENGDDTVNFTLKLANSEKTLKGQNVSIGTSVSGLAVNKYVTIQSSFEIDGNNYIVKEVTVNNKTLGSKIVGVSDDVPSVLKDKVISAETAASNVASYAYGEVSDDYYYVTGTIYSVVYDDTTSEYTIRLTTEGKDENHYFEIKRAKIDTTVVDASTLEVGNQITAYGKLTTDMNYTVYSK